MANTSTTLYPNLSKANGGGGESLFSPQNGSGKTQKPTNSFVRSLASNAHTTTAATTATATTTTTATTAAMNASATAAKATARKPTLREQATINNHHQQHHHHHQQQQQQNSNANQPHSLADASAVAADDGYMPRSWSPVWNYTPSWVRKQQQPGVKLHSIRTGIAGTVTAAMNAITQRSARDAIDQPSRSYHMSDTEDAHNREGEHEYERQHEEEEYQIIRDGKYEEDGYLVANRYLLRPKLKTPKRFGDSAEPEVVNRDLFNYKTFAPTHSIGAYTGGGVVGGIKRMQTMRERGLTGDEVPPPHMSNNNVGAVDGATSAEEGGDNIRRSSGMQPSDLLISTDGANSNAYIHSAAHNMESESWFNEDNENDVLEFKSYSSQSGGRIRSRRKSTSGSGVHNPNYPYILDDADVNYAQSLASGQSAPGYFQQWIGQLSRGVVSKFTFALYMTIWILYGLLSVVLRATYNIVVGLVITPIFLRIMHLFVSDGDTAVSRLSSSLNKAKRSISSVNLSRLLLFVALFGVSVVGFKQRQTIYDATVGPVVALPGYVASSAWNFVTVKVPSAISGISLPSMPESPVKPQPPSQNQAEQSTAAATTPETPSTNAPVINQSIADTLRSRLAEHDTILSQLSSVTKSLIGQYDELRAEIGDLNISSGKSGNGTLNLDGDDIVVHERIKSATEEHSRRIIELRTEVKRLAQLIDDASSSNDEWDQATSEIRRSIELALTSVDLMESRIVDIEKQQRSLTSSLHGLLTNQREMSDALRKNTPSNSNSNRYSSSGGNKESDSNPWLASVDYALESSGGRIVDKYTSSTYAVPPTPSTWFGSFVNVMTSHFGFPLGTLFGNPPSIVIQPDVAPGLCWPIHGSNGQVTLKFAQSVVLEAFTVHHAYPANISPESASTVAQSAIKDIEVHGIVDVKYVSHYLNLLNELGVPASRNPPSKSVLLARYAYKVDVENPAQSFIVNAQALEQLKIAPLPKDVAKDHKLPPYFPIASLQIRILSNHGNEKYTCMYRFRAHGKPAPAIQFDTDGNPSKASKASKAPKHAAL